MQGSALRALADLNFHPVVINIDVHEKVRGTCPTDPEHTDLPTRSSNEGIWEYITVGSETTRRGIEHRRRPKRDSNGDCVCLKSHVNPACVRNRNDH